MCIKPSDRFFWLLGLTCCIFGCDSNTDRKQSKAATYQACDVHGALVNRLEVTELYDRPSPEGEVIAELPVSHPFALSGLAGPEFRVIGSQDGWVHVESLGELRGEALGPRDDGSAANPREMYLGNAWVEAKHIGLHILSYKGFAEPNALSSVVVDQDRGPMTGMVKDEMTMIGCSGKWALVDQTLIDPLNPDRSVRKRAWFRGICDIYVTTCDGITAD